MADSEGKLEIPRHAEDPFGTPRRDQQKLRLAITGPAGSGRTLTALMLAEPIAAYEATLDPNMKGIAVLDTERGSATSYIGEVPFQHLAMGPPFTPQRYIGYIRAAYEWGYAVLILDSISHAWFAPGGVLEMVDQHRIRTGDKTGAWYEVNPAHNGLIDALTQTPIHIIATMRAQQEWLTESSEDGTAVRRIGTAPVQRSGIEYEFQFYAEMDLAHRFKVTKSRAREFDQRVWLEPDAAVGTEILGWLTQGEALPTWSQRRRIVALRADLTDDEKEAHKLWWAEQSFKTMSAAEATTTIEHLEALLAARPPKEPETEDRQPETGTGEEATPDVADLVAQLDEAVANADTTPEETPQPEEPGKGRRKR